MSATPTTRPQAEARTRERPEAPIVPSPEAGEGGTGTGTGPGPGTGPGLRVRGCCEVLNPGEFAVEAQQDLLTDLEALAHPIRLRLLAALAANPGRVCVCDLEAIVPVKQPTVSHHLRILRKAGLVDSERHGLWAHYRIRREAFRALAGRVGFALDILSGEAPADGGVEA